MNLAEAALSFVQDMQKYAVLCFAKWILLNGARWAKIIINVVYVASFVSPGGIHPDSFIRAISRLEIDSFVTRRARGAHAGIIGVRIRTWGYIKRAIRTPRSIIIQADELAINERLFSLINVTYEILVILYTMCMRQERQEYR